MSYKDKGFERYKTFGLERKWMEEFIEKIQNPDFDNFPFGSIQIKSLKCWLEDCGLLEKKTLIPTADAHLLAHFFYNNESLFWSIIYINLFYGSHLIHWYISSFVFNRTYRIPETEEMLAQYASITPQSTRKKIDSLLNLISKSPIGNSGLNLASLEFKGRIKTSITRNAMSEVQPNAVLYSLYRYAIAIDRFEFRQSEFYKPDVEGGPYRLFGINEPMLTKILLHLQDLDSMRQNNFEDWIIKAEFNMGLDNIHLNKKMIKLSNILTLG